MLCVKLCDGFARSDKCGLVCCIKKKNLGKMGVVVSIYLKRYMPLIYVREGGRRGKPKRVWEIQYHSVGLGL